MRPGRRSDDDGDTATGRGKADGLRSRGRGPAPPPRRVPIARWLVAVLRPIHWLLVRCYLRVHVDHPERIPAEGPVILAPTHRSRWDALVIHCVTRRPLRPLVSHDEFVGPQGWVMTRLGAFPVNTRRPTPGVLRRSRDLLRAGEVLVVFPEGTIFYYPPHNVHPLKPGTAWLALSCAAEMRGKALPIVPIRVVYGDRHPRFGTRVDVLVGPPIDPAAYLDRPRKEAIHLLTADLQAALGDVVNDSLAEMIPPRTPPESRDARGE